jgi:4-amino-4-deoxy-L-arabinose transferase-like glycosyltransferase
VSDPPTSDLSPRKFWIGVLVCLSLFTAWQCKDVGKPWIGVHDWNGAAWSTAARHLIERPLSETRMGVSLDHGSAPLDSAKSYVHHPPLVVWLLAGAYKLFGVSEAVGRAVPIAFSVLGAICLTGLATALAGRRAGLIGLFVFLSTPCLLFYGRMPNHEPIGLSMMIAASWAALAWFRNPTALRFALSIVAVVLACLSCWVAFVFAAALGLVALRQEPNGRSLFVGVGLASTATLLFLLWHIKTVRADGWTDLLAAFFLRSGGVGPWDWLTTMADWLLRLLTPVGCAAILLHACRVVRLPLETERALLPLVAAGWANVLLFRQGAWVHEYYVYFLSAPAAVVVGVVISQMQARNGVTWIVLLSCISAGLNTSSALRQGQSNLYASDVPESPRFIVELGRKIADRFPADVTLLVDSAAIGEHLGFYADRRLIHLAERAEADLPLLIASADGVVANIGLQSTRDLLARIVALAGNRIASRDEFVVEKHAFAAVKFRK